MEYVEHRFADASSGSVIVKATDQRATITYRNLEPIVDSLLAVDRTFSFGSGVDNIELTDDANADDTRMKISSATSETVNFLLPTERIFVNAGNGDWAAPIFCTRGYESLG